MCRADGAVLFLPYSRSTVLVKISLCGAAVVIATCFPNPDPMVVIVFTVQTVCVCVWGAAPFRLGLALDCGGGDRKSKREERGM